MGGEDGRGGEGRGEKVRGMEEKEGGWVGGPLLEILNTPLLKVNENYTITIPAPMTSH